MTIAQVSSIHMAYNISQTLQKKQILLFQKTRLIIYEYLAFAENQSVTVTIPRGAASPEVDITKLTPTQWYVPSRFL